MAMASCAEVCVQGLSPWCGTLDCNRLRWTFCFPSERKTHPRPPKTESIWSWSQMVPRWGFFSMGVSVFLKSSATFCRDRNLFSQWLTFKLLGITYLVEKKLKLLFHGPLAEWGKVPFGDTTSAFFTSKWAVQMFQTWCIWVLKNRWVFGEETIRKPIAIPFENTRYPSLSSSFF